MSLSKAEGIDAAATSPADGLLPEADASASPILSADLMSSVSERFVCNCGLIPALPPPPPADAASKDDLYVNPVGIGGNAALTEGKSVEGRGCIEETAGVDDKVENPAAGAGEVFGKNKFPRPKMSSSAALLAPLIAASPPPRPGGALESEESDARGEA